MGPRSTGGSFPNYNAPPPSHGNHSLLSCFFSFFSFYCLVFFLIYTPILGMQTACNLSKIVKIDWLPDTTLLF